MEDWRRKAVEGLKQAGQTIIDNAEKMIGGYKHQIGTIDVDICLERGCAPDITIRHELVPDDFEKH